MRLLPGGRALAEVVGRLLDEAYPIDSALDHGGTVAVYLRDPDGNGVELTYDRPCSEWFDDEGEMILEADPFDPQALLHAHRA
jgi:catechol 2,3-dioxygenase